MNWLPYWQALPIVLGMGFITWFISAVKKNLGIVDILWPLMFLASASWYALSQPERDLARLVLIILVAAWSLRLAIHLFVRNWNEVEDRRYAEMRANGGPAYTVKSLYKIFILQAILAWLVSMTLFTAFSRPTDFNTWSYLGIALWLTGFIFESVGDYQLLSFRSRPENQGKVLNTGLWRYTRHPNYFGEFLIWWGFYCFALPAAPLLGLVGPLMMSFFLMKFSGVPMLEKGITERRGQYAEYTRRTNTFFPGPVKKDTGQEQ
jgi:steroid 5-alpha reductase family enzyme